jgi:hypothetical protein
MKEGKGRRASPEQAQGKKEEEERKCFRSRQSILYVQAEAAGESIVHAVLEREDGGPESSEKHLSGRGKHGQYSVPASAHARGTQISRGSHPLLLC